jgi:GR25 family glycosyltransferase involved in LPS biosynthesis
MSFINSVVDAVVVINMADAKSRMAKMDAGLKQNRVNYDRFEAIVGKDVGRDDRLTGLCNSFCTDATKGCTLSHRTVWEMAQKNNWEYVLIFEDDVEIPANFDAEFKKVWEAVPRDFDVLEFGCDLYCNDKTWASELLTTLTNTRPEVLNDSVIRIKGLTCLHTYVVSRKGIEKLLAHSKLSTVPDLQMNMWIQSEADWRVYSSYPFMLYQKDYDNSTNSGNGKFPFLLDKLLSYVPWANNTNMNYAVFFNIGKVLGYNINSAIIVVFALSFFAGLRPALLVWLAVEFVLRPNWHAAVPYMVAIGVPWAAVAVSRKKFEIPDVIRQFLSRLGGSQKLKLPAGRRGK